MMKQWSGEKRDIAIKSFFKEIFGNRIVSKFGDLNWATQSPNLKLSDFFFFFWWEYLKS